ncbi:MAG: hypothetical protein NT027_10950 [Proteobacteria bacterium]|nr:hypothetical protein [Pseudomonadota bacterium]
MNQVTLTVPGKVMLAGEYAVLRGAHSLAVTVNISMVIQVTTQDHLRSWTVTSNIWSEPKTFSSDLRVPQDDPLCRTVQVLSKKHGLLGGHVAVDSKMDIKFGIGSSSALRLGISAAMQILKRGPSPGHKNSIHPDCLADAWALQSESQGTASGYDLATQYVGGLVEFSFEPDEQKWKPHWYRYECESLDKFVHVFVGGKGAPTSALIHATTEWLEGSIRTDRLIESSETLIDNFIQMSRFPSPNILSNLVSSAAAHRKLFLNAPKFPKYLEEILGKISGYDSTWTWKTTGAGGEDAIILIGNKADIRLAQIELQKQNWSRLDDPFTSNGISILSTINSKSELDSGKANTDLGPSVENSHSRTGFVLNKKRMTSSEVEI